MHATARKDAKEEPHENLKPIKYTTLCIDRCATNTSSYFNILERRRSLYYLVIRHRCNRSSIRRLVHDDVFDLYIFRLVQLRSSRRLSFSLSNKHKHTSEKRHCSQNNRHDSSIANLLMSHGWIQEEFARRCRSGLVLTMSTFEQRPTVATRKLLVGIDHL
jgi:hypothetical protein